ncbi:transcriptional regulator [Arthrospira sp. O9.13F]|nr:transcriptional regulator [Arthrospira sp. O9.13F]
MQKYLGKTSSECGKYPSAEDAIVAGIRLLADRERIYQRRFEELPGDIMVGVAAN